MTPAGFAMLASRGQWKLTPHLAILNRRLVDLASGTIDRQATFMPPRHGKSFFRSMWFYAWYLGVFPEHRVGLACYGADFAAEWGVKVRNILEEWGPSVFGVKVSPTQRRADSWRIEGYGGGMDTFGIGGPMTGKGFDLFGIDDPVKDAEEALSETIRRKHWDWYASTARTRLEPGGKLMLTMTPWHMGDLGGMILDREPGRWDILRLPALAEPSTTPRRGARGYDRILDQPDPLGRPVGAALWPERYPVKVLEEQRALEGQWFDAMYQCRPRPRDGGMFKATWFEGRVVETPPANATRVRHWDRAATHGAGDFTSGVKVSRDTDGRFFIEDRTSGQWSEFDRNRTIVSIARGDGHETEVSSEQEPGSSGKDQAAAFVRMLAGYSVKVKPSTGSKEVRAQPFADQCEAGNVYLVRGDWNVPFVDQLAAFPFGRNDDDVDAASAAFNRVVELTEDHYTYAMSDPFPDIRTGGW